MQLRVMGKLQKAGRAAAGLASLAQFIFFSKFELTNHNAAAHTQKRKGLWLEPCQMEYGDSSGELAKKCVCMHMCAETLYKIKRSLEFLHFEQFRIKCAFICQN